jgi:endonuclease YncB( thermonuclease family)
MIDLPPPFVCQVVKVHDGDGPLWCANGRKVRVAGVQAPDWEDAAPCRQKKAGYVCDDAKAAVSQRIAARLVLGKALDCRPVDRSWKRTVARCTLPDNRSLSCALIAAGAATRWDSYWRRYKMGGCR